MEIKFAIGDVVYFYPDNKDAIQFNNGYLDSHNFLYYVEDIYSGNVKKIFIEEDEPIKYEVHTFDVYGGFTNSYIIEEQELYSSKQEGKAHAVNRIRQCLDDLDGVLSEYLKEFKK